jgi:hypothetical protein
LITPEYFHSSMSAILQIIRDESHETLGKKILKKIESGLESHWIRIDLQDIIDNVYSIVRVFLPLLHLC